MIKPLVVSTMIAFAAYGQTGIGGADRLLVPRHESPTAMWRCGANLEAVKADRSLLHQYVFTGNEVLYSMQYCAEGKFAMSDDRHTYKVPAGTIGWISKNGLRVVMEECVNQALCIGCEPPPVQIVRRPPPPPRRVPPMRPPPVDREPPPTPEPEHVCSECLGFESIDSNGEGVELDSVYAGKGFPEFTVKGVFKGLVRNPRWTINNGEDILAEVLNINPENLDSGVYNVRLTATDEKGHDVICSFVMKVSVPPPPPKGKSWIKRHKKALIITGLVVCGASAAVSYGMSMTIPPCGYFGPAAALAKAPGIPKTILSLLSIF